MAPAGRKPMKINADRFRVARGTRVDLSKWPTLATPVYESDDHYAQLLKEYVGTINAQQQLLNASESIAVLVIFQAMDAGGKDGAIEHVMTGINPQGCRITSFKAPSEQELKHDFLWRTVRELPERGRIGIFNRSYYEDVLVVRVHPEKLRGEDLTKPRLDDNRVWHERYRSIVEFERHLHANSTRIVKIFLHISKGEQRKRLLQRIDTPGKNWKIRPEDIEERRFWADYMRVYGKCLTATSTRRAPWFVVPADDKRNARLIISKILLDAFLALDLKFPKTTPARRTELAAMRAQLAKEGRIK
jgi:PPK2 family polyphosphate:nucleotide phosphotransferase